jgi:hypothetical protein
LTLFASERMAQHRKANTMANSKIRAGLDARTDSPSAASFSLSALQGAPATISDLNAIANRVSSKRDRMKVLSDSVTTAVEKYRKAKTAEYAELGRVREGNLVRDELGDNRRRTMLEREVTRYSREARKISADERTSILAEIRDAVSKVAPVRASFTDPVAILSRRTIGDPKRSTYTANLANAGPVAVENAIQTAVITGNAPLLSAALDRLDGMPAASRKLVRYSKKDAAETVVGDELLKARQYLAKIDLETAETELAYSESEGKRDTAEDKIRLGTLRNELLVALGSDPESDDDDTDDGAGDETGDDYPTLTATRFAFRDGELVPVPEGGAS